MLQRGGLPEDRDGDGLGAAARSGVRHFGERGVRAVRGGEDGGRRVRRVLPLGQREDGELPEPEGVLLPAVELHEQRGRLQHAGDRCGEEAERAGPGHRRGRRGASDLAAEREPVDVHGGAEHGRRRVQRPLRGQDVRGGRAQQRDDEGGRDARRRAAGVLQVQADGLLREGAGVRDGGGHSQGGGGCGRAQRDGGGPGEGVHVQRHGHQGWRQGVLGRALRRRGVVRERGADGG